jgi:hypothetical protein
MNVDESPLRTNTRWLEYIKQRSRDRNNKEIFGYRKIYYIDGDV